MAFTHFSNHRSAVRRLLWPTLCVLALFLVAGSVTACRGGDGKAAVSKPTAPKQQYRCPMHPEVVSDHPGDCPICGMALVPFTPEPAPPQGQAVPPASTSSPSSGGSTPAAPTGHEGHGAGAPASAGGGTGNTNAPPSVMNLGPERARIAGVRSVEVTKGELAPAVRAVGTVAIDETRVRQVTTKVEGYIERLHVNTTGQTVRPGEPLFELYSPELLASQEEYLRARQSAGEFEKSSLPEVRRGGHELAQAARRRLELFDVPPDFIKRLDETGQVQRTVVFRAPFAGFVTGKNIVAGQRIEPGMELLTVSDLSRVWVIAQVYEAESALARAGRPATITAPYDPSVRLKGRVGFVYPTLEAETRTLRVRLEFDNPRGTLRPGMYVNVELGASPVVGALVPDSAVLDTGTRQLVFVETGPGQYQARDVSVAARADGQAVLRSGIEAGERVAVSANFLLDSESRLRAALAGRK